MTDKRFFDDFAEVRVDITMPPNVVWRDPGKRTLHLKHAIDPLQLQDLFLAPRRPFTDDAMHPDWYQYTRKMERHNDAIKMLALSLARSLAEGLTNRDE